MKILLSKIIHNDENRCRKTLRLSLDVFFQIFNKLAIHNGMAVRPFSRGEEIMKIMFEKYRRCESRTIRATPRNFPAVLFITFYLVIIISFTSLCDISETDS